jgi:hypothetical protein
MSQVITITLDGCYYMDNFKDVKDLIDSNKDKHGLVNSNIFDKILSNRVKIENYWIAIDNNLSNSLKNLLELKFNDPYSDYWKNKCQLRLRLNLGDIIEADNPPSSHGEKAHWMGPPFSWDDIDTYKYGLDTRHANFLNGFHRLDCFAQAKFSWRFPRDETVGILQIEEFNNTVTEPFEYNSDKYMTRYLHSIRDRSRRTFTHIDGASKTYDQQSYKKAYNENGIKGEEYIKLFRIDGDMSNINWYGYVFNFFNRDHLIEEYFGIDNSRGVIH